MIGFPADFSEESVNIWKVLSPKPPIRPHGVLSLECVFLSPPGRCRAFCVRWSCSDVGHLVSSTWANKCWDVTHTVGRGGVSYSVLQYSFMVVWHRLLLWGTVWMWDFAWKNWLEHEHEQAYDYDNREQVCFRLYCLWVGLSCLAVFLVATLWRSAHRLCPWQWCRCCWSRDGEDKKPTWCSERPKQLVLYRRSTHMVNPTINKFPGSSV